MFGFRLSVKPTASRTLRSLEYNEEAGVYGQDAAITIEGVTKLTTRLGALLINGKELWDDMPVQFRITARPPIVFPDPEKRQTLPVVGGINEDMIKQCIGDLYFLAAWEDPEMNIKEADRLYGNVSVTDIMFSDIWDCARTPGSKFQSLYFSVFGEAMRLRKSCGRTEYDWTAPEEAFKGVPLYIASFSYWAGQRSRDTAVVT
jgi:hypothetical protein